MSAKPLGPILCATFTSPDPAATARDYATHLDQTVVEQGPLPPRRQQGAPAAASRPSVLLRPRSAESGWFRIIQGAAAPPPLAAFGWLAMEILVKSTDAVSARLTDLCGSTDDRQGSWVTLETRRIGQRALPHSQGRAPDPRMQDVATVEKSRRDLDRVRLAGPALTVWQAPQWDRPAPTGHHPPDGAA